MKVALLYPGDRTVRERAAAGDWRFTDLFDAFDAEGVVAEPVVYHDDFADDVARQLAGFDAVLVWCNPIEGGIRRTRLDALLREASQAGLFVSAHPDSILRLGTKDVLLDTRDLPFGSDVVRVDRLDQLARELPERLRVGPRVLKQHRGQSGVGVWRVEQVPGTNDLLVHHAQRGSQEERMDLRGLLERLAPYFEMENGGHMIDQAWQPRIVEGTVRAYLVEDRVCGFGHQLVNALSSAEKHQPTPVPSPRLYHPPDLAQFAGLKAALEGGWIDQLCEKVGLRKVRLPLLWDCDFMFGEALESSDQRFVLCEVNVSSVSPYPPSVVLPLVRAAKCRIGGRRENV